MGGPHRSPSLKGSFPAFRYPSAWHWGSWDLDADVHSEVGVEGLQLLGEQPVAQRVHAVITPPVLDRDPKARTGGRGQPCEAKAQEGAGRGGDGPSPLQPRLTSGASAGDWGSAPPPACGSGQRADAAGRGASRLISALQGRKQGGQMPVSSDRVSVPQPTLRGRPVSPSGQGGPCPQHQGGTCSPLC